MLQITIDAFSGRPNPSWLITDNEEVQAILREVSLNRAVLPQGAKLEAPLGFRGIIVEPFSEGVGQDLDLSGQVYIPTGTNTAANALLERVLSVVSNEKHASSQAAEGITLESEFLGHLKQVLKDQAPGATLDTEAFSSGARGEEAELAAITCYIENYAFNPGFWNNDPNVRSNNNCYNYASNKRTNTFAQPGRGCGHMYTTINCGEMTRASLCDGLHHRYNCFPSSEAPRHLVALVVAPGPGFVDFHWYRHQKEGFWGHKPGGTAARNFDNSNHIIYDPRYCDRGPYTQFCGFFYTCRSQKIR